MDGFIACVLMNTFVFMCTDETFPPIYAKKEQREQPKFGRS